NCAAGHVGRAGIEAAFERSTHSLQIAVARGLEDPFTVALVDGGLELPPAREAVRAGDEQLGAGQRCRGVLAPDLLEALLGFVSEVLEVGTGGEHGNLPG